jgi:hypothetical protein
MRPTGSRPFPWSWPILVLDQGGPRFTKAKAAPQHAMEALGEEEV